MHNLKSNKIKLQIWQIFSYRIQNSIEKLIHLRLIQFKIQVENHNNCFNPNKNLFLYSLHINIIKVWISNRKYRMKMNLKLINCEYFINKIMNSQSLKDLTNGKKKRKKKSRRLWIRNSWKKFKMKIWHLNLKSIEARGKRSKS
jgi:hypothetical protein